MHHRATTPGRRGIRAASTVVFAAAVAFTASGCGASGGGSGRNSSGSEPTSLPVAGESRSVPWTETGKHTEHDLRVAPKLARGKPSDLKHVRLEDDLKGKVPYYLTVSYTNTGKKTLQDPDPESDFGTTDTEGHEGKPITTFGGFGGPTHKGLPRACRKQGPDKLKAGGKATACQIVMMPKGRQPASVSYVNDQDDPQTTPYVWKVGGHRDTAARSLHEPGTSYWRNAGKASTRIRVTPKSVRKGSISDLGRFRLDKRQKQAVPYYVTLEYRNDGGQKLYPDMQDEVRLGADTGRWFKKLDLLDFSGTDPVPSCPERKPFRMVPPKSTVTQCSVHLVPKGDEPATVSFSGNGKGAKELTWHAK